MSRFSVKFEKPDPSESSRGRHSEGRVRDHSVLSKYHSVRCAGHSVMCTDQSVLCSDQSAIGRNYSLACNYEMDFSKIAETSFVIYIVY